LRACVLTLALCALGAAPAGAQTISERAETTALTVYAVGGGTTQPLENSSDLSWAREAGLALVTETRMVDLPAGRSELRFRNVVSTIVPQTADIKGLPSGAVERNFDYDLLSPGSLLAKSIGNIVQLWRTNPKTGVRTEEAAIVRSSTDGPMLEVGGKLEALRCSGLAEKLVFDKIPDGLTDTPTLSVWIDLPEAGHYTLKLSYLATALGWSSNYVAQIHPERGTLDLSGWITLANFSETSFDNAPVKLVAGALNLTGNDNPASVEPMPIANTCWKLPKVKAQPQQEYAPSTLPGVYADQVETVVVTGSRIPAPLAYADYKLYTLPGPTSVKALQIKQLQFLDQREVPFERVYSYTVQNDYPDQSVISDTANVTIRLQNRTDRGLGMPLPAGRIAVNELNESSDPILLGEGQVGNIAVGLPVEFQTGNAMGVYVEQRVLDSRKLGEGQDGHTVNSFEVDVENQKPVAIDFELQHGYGGAGFHLIAEDRPHQTVPYGLTWNFHLKPGENVRLHFTVDEGHW
jgi:hypothetical protein